MQSFNTRPDRIPGSSHRCANGYHQSCDRAGCTCPCHQGTGPSYIPTPTPDKAT